LTLTELISIKPFLLQNCGGSILNQYENNEYVWRKISYSEIERLEKTLANHLRKMGIKRTKRQREKFVLKVLDKQNYTCAFGGGDGRYCWNHPRNNSLNYLKLEWAHKIPSYYKNMSQIENNLLLLCARCNNQIQSSRTIKQLILELEHKLRILKRLEISKLNRNKRK
jgi:5-methylcytosine-specific restriction endonuclease McrA